MDMTTPDKYEELCKEITRLQEKYDENGYDFPPIIKLQRIEQEVDYAMREHGELKQYPRELLERTWEAGHWRGLYEAHGATGFSVPVPDKETFINSILSESTQAKQSPRWVKAGERLPECKSGQSVQIYYRYKSGDGKLWKGASNTIHQFLDFMKLAPAEEVEWLDESESPKEEAVEFAGLKFPVFSFAEWASHSDWTFVPSKRLWYNEEEEERITPKTSTELYNLFKQTK